VVKLVDKLDQQLILNSIDGFCKALRMKGYSERSIGVNRPVLGELTDFFVEVNPSSGSEFIDQFINWKLNRRSKKKYHWSHRYRQTKIINNFFDYYLARNKTLHYNRYRFEKHIAGYAGGYEGKNQRFPIEIRNSLAAFFDYLEHSGIKRLKKGKDKPIDQQVICEFLDKTEKDFYKKRRDYCSSYKGVTRQLLLNFHTYLLEQGHLSFYAPPPVPKGEPLQFETPINQYLEYLNQSGLSQSSVGAATRELWRFDCYLQSKDIKKLNKVKITHIDEHVQKQVASSNLRGIHKLNSIMRRFFKFLYVSGHLNKDLSKYINAAPIYRLSDVPKHLSTQEVKAVLSFAKPMLKSDLKKKAVLSLLMFNGLRAAEAAKLSIDDIDWDGQTITITNRKNRQPLITPMSDYVKAALMEYISKARPNGYHYREVFLTEFAPIKPISSRGITQMMRRQLRKHGVDCGGAHRMRHTFGTYLLESDSSIIEAQLLMGHKRVNATRIYGKSSLKRMREHVVSDEI